MRPLNSVGVSMYVGEVRALVGAILFRLHTVEQARSIWLEHREIASRQAAASHEDFSLEKFGHSLNAAVAGQLEIFEVFEALLAAWARLSLLVHPIEGRDEMAEWRATRGAALRAVLDLPSDTLLASRSFRDSWMHFDERLDRAFVDGWLGNLQQFVKSDGVKGAMKVSVRVIDIEGLSFHYRTRDGLQESVALEELKRCLRVVERGLEDVGSRIMHHFASA